MHGDDALSFSFMFAYHDYNVIIIYIIMALISSIAVRWRTLREQGQHQLSSWPHPQHSARHRGDYGQLLVERPPHMRDGWNLRNHPDATGALFHGGAKRPQ